MNREEWLELRKKGIGGSEASAVVGLNPWLTNLQLWEYKVGKATPEDISGKDCVIFGNKAEEPIRKIFELNNPQYQVDYNDFDLRFDNEHPFLICTLDGFLTEKETLRKGILEIKTSNLTFGYGQKWNEIPLYYLCQVLHNMMVCDVDFGVLYALLKNGERAEFKKFIVERSNTQHEIDTLRQAEITFWQENVLKNKHPNLILPRF